MNNRIIDFTDIQEEQNRFLERLERVNSIKYQKDAFSVPMWIVLALQSELSEILNASKIHKWWDKSEVDRKHLAEECADFLSHLGNLANILEVELIASVEEVQRTCIENQINYLAYKITTLPWKKQFAKGKLLNNLLPGFIELVYSLGFDIDDIKKAYRSKMDKNILELEQGIWKN